MSKKTLLASLAMATALGAGAFQVAIVPKGGATVYYDPAKVSSIAFADGGVVVTLTGGEQAVYGKDTFDYLTFHKAESALESVSAAGQEACGDYVICDTQGRTVARGRGRVDTSALAPGAYLVTTAGGGTSKILVR